jgi:hypothetical protein
LFFSISSFFKQSMDGPGSFKPVASKIPPQLPTLPESPSFDLKPEGPTFVQKFILPGGPTFAFRVKGPTFVQKFILPEGLSFDLKV